MSAENSALDGGRPAPRGAVFLSYASQDAEAVRRIAEALRVSGVEVWFDQNELVGGDAWDAKIRGQIGSCALFVPVISAATQARLEGYFRIEWKLAAQRTHAMAEEKAFLLPVVIDDTRDAEAKVPGEFRAVQWTWLPDGEVSVAFCARVKALLGFSVAGSVSAQPPIPSPGSSSALPPKPRWSFALSAGAFAIIVAIGTALFVSKKSSPPPAERAQPATTPSGLTANPSPAIAPSVAADPKTIAVLPFENLSTEPDSDLFANGMHEEMLTALGKVGALNVIGRTSVLPYREAARRNLPQISAELGVGSVVEGSVRRAGQRVRISVQLVDARTRRQLWADSYERDFTDVFAIQAAVAGEVVAKLSAKLTPREQSVLAQQPSENARAYQLYVESRSLFRDNNGGSSREKYYEIVRKLEEATRLDPHFGGAFAQLAYTHAAMFFFPTIDSTPARATLAQRALAEAQRLAPDSGETHVAAGYFAYACLADYPAALRSLEAALPTNPNDSSTRYTLGLVLRRLGRHEEAAVELERSVALDPLDSRHYRNLIQSLMMLRRFTEVVGHAERRSRLRAAEGMLSAYLVRARFELDGNQTRFVEGWKELAVDADDAEKADLLANAALAAGNLVEALRMLSDLQIEARLQGAALLGHLMQRAELAFALGRGEEVTALALRARASMGAARKVRFGESAVIGAEMTLAAMTGRKSEALGAMGPLRESTKDDQFISRLVLFNIATAHLLLGDETDALDGLTLVMNGPSPVEAGPRGIHLHPIWSRLNGNPRFEAILQRAKPL